MDLHQDINQYWLALYDRPLEQRAGQWAFNTLVRMRPELANRLKATGYDPFYDDEKLPVFYDWVDEMWHSEYIG